MTRLAHALIVGGTGMLADASREIARRAERVTLAARRPAALAAEIGAAAVPFDWGVGDVSAIAAAVRDAPPDMMLSWVHDAGAAVVPGLEALLAPGALSIRVHGSASGDPAVMARRETATRDDVTRRAVILGWVEDASARRWLTDAEISAGAVRALDDPAPLQVVGTDAGPAPRSLA